MSDQESIKSQDKTLLLNENKIYTENIRFTDPHETFSFLDNPFSPSKEPITTLQPTESVNDTNNITKDIKFDSTLSKITREINFDRNNLRRYLGNKKKSRL